MNSTIKAFRFYTSGYTPIGVTTYYSDFTSHKVWGSSGRMVDSGVVLKAVLTQEVNNGGSFSVSLRKPETIDEGSPAKTSITNLLGNYSYYIEVETPYNMDGNEAYASSYPERLTKWRGMRANTVEHTDHIDITFEGELSYLSKIVLNPYSLSAYNATNFVSSMIARYNNEVDTSAYLRFKFANSSDVDNGPVVARSNSNVSTVWDEINDKILKKYDNQLSICDYPSTNNQRTVYLRRLPLTPSGIINGQDIMSATHTVNGSERSREWILFGAQTSEAEGDINRISSSYRIYTSGYERNVTVISQTFRIYDDVTTTDTLASKAQDLYNRALLESDGIELSITPQKASELVLGSLYTISCPRVGISGNYRLTKRVIDVLNPSKNKYTFGTAQKFITR